MRVSTHTPAAVNVAASMATTTGYLRCTAAANCITTNPSSTGARPAPSAVTGARVRFGAPVKQQLIDVQIDVERVFSQRSDADGEHVQTEDLAKQSDCSERLTCHAEPQPSGGHDRHHKFLASAVCMRARSGSITAGSSMSITGVESYNS